MSAITIVGAGNVGSALASGFRTAGHDVRLAVRTPREGLPAPTVAVAGAADDADFVVLAVPYMTVVDVLGELAPPAGRIVVDATNPFGRPIPDGHTSTAALVAATVPHCRVVKAFNVVGAEHMTDPRLAGGARVLLPVAADDDDARSAVSALAREIGFDAIEVGGLENAEIMEWAARYWGLLAFTGGLGRQFALAALPPEPA